MSNFNNIINDLQQGKTAPIYFLMGEEPYFIDEISNFIEKNVLSEEEKGFNQMVLYGLDVEIEDIISNAKRFPMMAEKQVIIVKEAQNLSRTIDKLESYIENPQPSTVLVICYKYKTIDKRKKLYKQLQKNAVVFESKPLRDYQMGDWIRDLLMKKGFKIEPKATIMLEEFLGTDLSKINNEIEKLRIILPEKSTITPTDIEENIGISKDFNNFELQKAVGSKEVLKANRIINHFSKNPKDNPLVMTLALLNSFFTKLLIYHSLKGKSKANVAKHLKINPFFVSDYATAGRNYPMRKVSQVISLLHDADVKSKGVGSNSLPQSEILKELLFKIIH
ncbi:MAG: DNA polymerase III subunit delta [Flavobacteriaceae bacterium]|nr:DNA polymerase III subunit delta [Flavobacteriaceae bacterium]